MQNERRIFKVQRQLIDDKFKHHHHYVNLSRHSTHKGGQTMSHEDAVYISELDNRRITSLHLGMLNFYWSQWRANASYFIDYSHFASFQPVGTQCRWNLLNSGRNRLGNKGCRVLTQASFPKLKVLSLSNCQNIQMTTGSRKVESIICPKESGSSLRSLIWVAYYLYRRKLSTRK